MMDGECNVRLLSRYQRLRVQSLNQKGHYYDGWRM